MAYKVNISDKGKAWKLETEAEALVGMSVGDKFNGKELSADFDGYELEITGGSDIAGFPLSIEVAGLGLRRVLLKKGWGMKDKRKGLRLRKTVRGKTISEKVSQINLNVVKEGNKKLEEIFPDQNKKIVKEEEKKSENTDGKSE